MDYNFDNVNLPKSEIELLKLIKKNGIAQISEKKLINSELRSMIIPITSGQDEYGNFITTGEYKLSKRGEAFLEYYKTKIFYRKSEHIRGWITTVVAFLAFILSIISLLLQYQCK